MKASKLNQRKPGNCFGWSRKGDCVTLPWVGNRKFIVLLTERWFWCQSAFYTESAVCNLQSVFYTERFIIVIFHENKWCYQRNPRIIKRSTPSVRSDPKNIFWPQTLFSETYSRHVSWSVPLQDGGLMYRWLHFRFSVVSKTYVHSSFLRSCINLSWGRHNNRNMRERRFIQPRLDEPYQHGGDIGRSWKLVYVYLIDILLGEIWRGQLFSCYSSFGCVLVSGLPIFPPDCLNYEHGYSSKKVDISWRKLTSRVRSSSVSVSCP